MKYISLITSLVLSSVALFGQVNGIIVNGETNQPVNIVAVAIQGKAIGTYSNEQGLFSLSDIRSSDSIIFRHIGYSTNTISCTDLDDSIRLYPKINNLGEIMIFPTEYSEKKSKVKNRNSGISFAGFPGLELTHLVDLPLIGQLSNRHFSFQ